MVPVEAHLSLNHVPIVGLLFGLVFMLIGVRRNSVQAIRAALQTFVVVGLIAAVTGISGLVAADILSTAQWLDANAVHAHEVAGITTVILISGLASFALFVLFSLRRTPAISRAVTMSLFALALAGLGSALWTAYLGGRIRHSELRGVARADVAPRDALRLASESSGTEVALR